MKRAGREARVASRGRRRLWPWTPGGRRRRPRAFTLIEIMIVVGILAVVMAMGVPAIYRIAQKEDLRKAISDIVEVCSNARAQAILRGTTVEMHIRPLEGQFSVGFAPAPQDPMDALLAVEAPVAPTPPPPRSGMTAQVADSIAFEMVDVNLVEYKDAETARVRFHPNGTSDEMTIVLRSHKNEFRKISLEITTGLATVETIGFR